MLAPADGTVVQVTDSYADNPPGRPDQVLPSGNRVPIWHGNQEYSLLTHLKQNSIKIKQGAKVKQGDVAGECGNSGNSPAPHLEYRLQNSRGIPLPQTMPVQFVDYVAGGKTDTGWRTRPRAIRAQRRRGCGGASNGRREEIGWMPKTHNCQRQANCKPPANTATPAAPAASTASVQSK